MMFTTLSHRGIGRVLLSSPSGLGRAAAQALQRGTASRRKSRTQRVAAGRRNACRRRRWSSRRQAGNAGQYGGDIVTLVPRPRDIRYITTYAYTRLVGYDRDLELKPDILESVDNDRRPHLHLHSARRPSLVGRRTVHRGGFPLLLGRRRQQPRAVARRRPGIHDRRRQAARSSRCSTSATCATPGTIPIPASCRSSPDPVDPGIYRPGALPQEVPREICRQGEARGGGEGAEAEIVGGASQPPRRHEGADESGSAGAAALARDEPRAGKPLRLRAQSVLSPRRHQGAAASLCRPHHHGRVGERPFCREGQCGRGRSPVPRIVDGRHPGPEAGRESARLHDAAVALCARIGTRALSQPQCDRSGLARAQPRLRATAARFRSASTARPSTTRCSSASGSRATTPSWRRARSPSRCCAHSTPTTIPARPRACSTRSG